MYKYTLLAALVASSVLASPANAGPRSVADAGTWDAERFQIRGRIISVSPDEDSSVSPIGGKIDADSAVTPELDFSYFFTDNIAAELIAATSKHDVSHSTVGDLGDAWVLPPSLTLQYHFTPNNMFSPYVGAGVNYSIFYGEDEAAGINSLEVDNGFGWVLQAGADVWTSENWGLNLDVKKIFLNVDASVNSGGVTADIDMDPWVIGAGVSYRF